MTARHASDPASHPKSEEHSYLLRRAEDHRQLAEKTDDAGSRMIHLRFQQLYTERAASVSMVLTD